MIILSLTLHNIYGFTDFHINFSYPRKIRNSIIVNEHLAGRPNFRYKKAVILMGANATGKTCLGKAIFRILKFINTGDTSLLQEMVSPGMVGEFAIDLVSEGLRLHRLSGTICSDDARIALCHACTEIKVRDSYEKCASRLPECMTKIPSDTKTLKLFLGNWHSGLPARGPFRPYSLRIRILCFAR